MCRSVCYCALRLSGFRYRSRGAVMRPDVPSSEYEAFFADSRFQSVGWLTGSNANSNYEFVVGSGVLIAPDWVLTNAHVINSKVVGMFDTMAFSLSNSVYSEPPNYHLSDALFVYPDYVNDAQIGTGIDLGLIHLSTPVADATPATRFYGTDQRGTLMFCAGFGKPGVANNDGGVFGVFDGKGRAGSVVANHFANDNFSLVVSGYTKPEYWLARMLSHGTKLEWLLSPGDSGGSWFADTDQNGTYELVGISSFTWGYYDFDSYSGAVRVSMFNDWIDTTIANWTSPVLLGDYNNNGTVDAADYVVWRA